MVGTALTIAGWFASALINMVIQKVTSHLEGNYDLNGGRESMLKALHDVLPHMETEIIAALETPIGESSRAAQLRRVKDDTYWADNVLDDLESEFLSDQVKDEKKVRVFKFIKLMVLADNNLNNYNLNKLLNHMEKKYPVIRYSIEKLISSMKKNLSPREDEDESFLDPKEIIGRDEEINFIRRKLSNYTEEASTSTAPIVVVVIPIVGIGGVGKTALARHIYDNETALSRSHFPLHAWVNVHGSLEGKNATNIARRLVSKLLKCEEGANRVMDYSSQRANRVMDDSLECILRKLQNMTQNNNKRFLIVLDDVQDVDKNSWTELKTALSCGARGSSVLVTTQYQRVAKTMKTVEPVQLDLLNEDAHQKVLERYALSEPITQEHLKQNLQSIAKNISKTLQGLPLAAKALGEELSEKTKESRNSSGELNNERALAGWNSILKSKWWEHDTVLGCILPSLGLNYQELEANQKLCFAYCSIFPKKYSFVEDRLVHMWMAQGFIQPKFRGEMSMEDIGRQIFTELVHRNFFQKISENEYRMPDVIRELAVYLSLDDSFVVNDETEIPSSVYHLTINSSKLDVFTGKDRHKISFKKMRTILFFGKYETKEFYKVLKDILSHSKSLRVLDLSGTEISKLPRAISDLSHLRYLDISNTKISMLPKSFCKLFHLQVLNLQHCPINGLPECMNKLISLRHVHVDSKTVSLISGIGKQTCLQELKECYVRKEEGHKIEELKNLLRASFQEEWACTLL